PYENVTDAIYPAIFALTSLNDTRVLYHEPAKWMAELRATAGGGPFLLKTEMEAGHGGRSGRYDAWQEEALVLAWIISTATAKNSLSLTDRRAGERVLDDQLGGGSSLPAPGVRALARLDLLVYVEEVPDLGRQVRRDVVEVLDAVDPGVVRGHGEDLGV